MPDSAQERKTESRFLDLRGGATQCDVVASGCVIKERVNAVGRVEIAGGIAKERLKTVGRVAIAGSIA